YPGIAETIEADLGNVALLRRMLKITAPSQDVDALLAELRERITEELDYRAVFRSLYEMHAFNGDPHPGNYLFHGGGRVTFLDFGLVKHFTDHELRPL